MFSLDNFLLNHMPAKSRNLFNDFCDPSLAYWPDDYSWTVISPRRRSLSPRNLYNTFLNTLIDDIIDTPKEIEMESPREKDQLKPVEDESELKSNNETNNKIAEKSDNKAVQKLKPIEYSLRLNQYKPEDITVNVKDNRLTIKGKKERKAGTSYSCQQFERTITLPKDVEAKSILCSMDSNGLIKLNIPRKRLEEEEGKQIKVNIESNGEDKQNESTALKSIELANQS